jgi:hypothetical protein
MKLSSFIRRFSRGGFYLLLCAALFSGCKRDDVKVYHVEKDDSTPVVAPVTAPNADSSMIPGQDSSSLPQLKWTLPDGWSEKTPGQMRVASFNVAGTNGEVADVGIIPLPASGQEIQLVNMWRGQMKLAAATNDDSEAVAIGSDSGKLFDIASDTLLIDGKFRARILVAMLTSGGTSWFFKMTGEESFVAAQKPAFLQFLKSISFSEPTATPFAHGMEMTPAATPSSSSESSGKPAWTIPAGWQEAPPSEFLLAKFIIGEGDAKAQVNISQLAGEGGGLLANANRWRGQLGLPQISETDLPALTTSIDSVNGKIQIVDFTGTDTKTGKSARLVGVVVPLAGQTWFYKLMGDEQIVAQQKDAFTKFVQSAKYPNAP